MDDDSTNSYGQGNFDMEIEQPNEANNAVNSPAQNIVNGEINKKLLNIVVLDLKNKEIALPRNSNVTPVIEDKASQNSPQEPIEANNALLSSLPLISVSKDMSKNEEENEALHDLFNKRPWICPGCQKVFVVRGHFVNHLKNKHANHYLHCQHSLTCK